MDCASRHALLHCNLGQVVHIVICLSPSCDIRYWCKDGDVSDSLWKRCNLPFYNTVHKVTASSKKWR